MPVRRGGRVARRSCCRRTAWPGVCNGAVRRRAVRDGLSATSGAQPRTEALSDAVALASATLQKFVGWFAPTRKNWITTASHTCKETSKLSFSLFCLPSLHNTRFLVALFVSPFTCDIRVADEDPVFILPGLHLARAGEHHPALARTCSSRFREQTVTAGSDLAEAARRTARTIC